MLGDEEGRDVRLSQSFVATLLPILDKFLVNEQLSESFCPQAPPRLGLHTGTAVAMSVSTRGIGPRVCNQALSIHYGSCLPILSAPSRLLKHCFMCSGPKCTDIQNCHMWAARGCLSVVDCDNTHLMQYDSVRRSAFVAFHSTHDISKEFCFLCKGGEASHCTYLISFKSCFKAPQR